ncbi:MAG: tandem-95 repeat protein [Methanoregulaceae archaeon]|nr:MAG: tandem-95 repeat protein [Methanoregulaceae archaeon]
MTLRYLSLMVLVIVTFLIFPAPVAAAVWNSETVESAGNVGKDSSIDLDSHGYPHISYYNEGGQDLKYAWKDAGGWHMTTVDSTGSVGTHTSLVVDSSDHPHISYYDATNTALKYAWKDAGGWHLSTVTSEGSSGIWSSIALYSDYPRISYSYNDGWNDHLKYAWKDDEGWHTQTADSSNGVGTYNSLAVNESDNTKGISYYDATNGALKYAYKDSGGWHTETVHDPASREAGLFSSLALDSRGYPHISYKWSFGNDLWYAWKDADGWHNQSVDLPGNDGDYTSIEIDRYDNPHISYYGDGELKYAWKKPSGSWEITPVDSAASFGQTSLALDSGNYPRISYYDGTNSALKYAWLTGNRAPAPVLDTYTTPRDAALIIAAPGVLANDIDLDGDDLTASLQNLPSNGTVTMNADGSFVYTPADGYTGSVLFTYLADDGDLSAAATVIINVLPTLNHRPVARNNSYVMPVNGMLEVPAPGILGNDDDADGDHLSAIMKTKTTHGKVILDTDGSFRYTPQLNYQGTDLFSYVANDSHIDSKVAWVSILVTNKPLLPLPGLTKLPTDPDGDGIFEDLNANGRLDFADVVLYFNQMTWIAANEPVCAFDLNGNGRIDFADIVALFNEI